MIVLVFVGNDTEIYHTHIWQSLPHYAIQCTASIHELFISELMTIITLYTVTIATEMDLKYLLSDKFDFHLITLSLLSKERVFLMSLQLRKTKVRNLWKWFSLRIFYTV